MIKALLVDDEALAIQRLEIKLSKHADVEVIGSCRDGDSAILAIEQKKPDLVLLDISMPGADGLSVAEKALENNVMVIFVTAFMQYAVPAFDKEAVDYLLKPVSTQRLDVALERYRNRKSHYNASANINELKSVILQLRQKNMASSPANQHDDLWIKDKGRKLKISLADLEWVEAARDYVSLHMVSGQYHFIRDSMRHIEKKLGKTLFQRVHRSAIVNLSYVNKVINQDGTQILHLQSGKSIRVGRGYKPATNLRLKEMTELKNLT